MHVLDQDRVADAGDDGLCEGLHDPLEQRVPGGRTPGRLGDAGEGRDEGQDAGEPMPVSE